MAKDDDDIAIEEIDEDNPPGLRTIGKYNPNKVRMSLVLEAHLIGINRLGRENLWEYGSRAKYKSAVRTLEVFLKGYQDEKYTQAIATDVTSLTAKDINTEVKKCQAKYAALMDLMLRAGLTPKAQKRYQTVE
jgi:hypothetical protein